MPLETVTTQMAGCWSFSSNKQNSFAAIQPECLLDCAIVAHFC
jgi:hypothetical protein